MLESSHDGTTINTCFTSRSLDSSTSAKHMLAAFVGRLMQNCGGCDLDVRNENEEIEHGRTTFICASRSQVLSSGTEELLSAIRTGGFDCRIPLEVDFFGEGELYPRY